MIDFTQDTDWFINSHYFLRKINDFSHVSIDSFLNSDLQNNLNKNEITQLTNSIDSNDNPHAIFSAGLIDKRSQQLTGIIYIQFATSKHQTAQVRILSHPQYLLPSSLIKELLIWIIDYTFYCLDIRQIIVITNKSHTTLINLLETLAFNKVEQVPLSQNGDRLLKVSDDIFYSLHETQWLSNDTDITELDYATADNYIYKIVRPYFQTTINQPLYSTIIDFRYQTILCTNQSAISIGLSLGDEALGTSYKYYSRVDLAAWYFGKWYTDKSAKIIHRYARKIFRIQQYVFKTGHTASFIDSLPYDRGICSYLITFIPIFNETGQVIAIQSVALNYRLAGYHEYIQNLLEQNKSTVDRPLIKLSKREEEVLFLLICGITQEQIAEILEVKRETIASIIRNQLRIKFALPIANTKLVVEKALSYGFPFSIPESLWRPSVIVLEEKLAAWLQQYHLVI
ncbi:MAG: hypothetical protein EKK57_12275 [Proteobacteria bacterium]|nr:MAG: hypothetical protein EKK57_12275 [Pseudomonadota bacterium]